MANLTQEQKKIIKKVHEFVKKESENSPVNEEVAIFEAHIKRVVNFSERLAEECNANKFVAVLAAYLHDISYIIHSNHDAHEILGAEFVKKYLTQFNISEGDINLVSACVLNHRGSKKSQRISIEEKIVASADAMAHIDNCLGMLYRTKDKTFEEAIEFMRAKLKRSWEKIELEEAKKMIKPKFEAAKTLFEF